ncbi:thyroid adenoma-associated protein homolog isoform X1 [Girardinichthys multiradiatus]|uniref:thyroid adenoma-associated protein homolog isoform X1 n=2 Tax=Girardinichthys multiradiatus TaxID=208333 RepID=UPI001FAC189F|nr:thyroid adenoma-associated protein homolog isoform X1 [Girardinichthys multiradiatus]
MSFENLIKHLHHCLITEDPASENGCQILQQFVNKLSESSRSRVKRSKERSLEEAVQLLKQISEAQLRGMEKEHLLLLVRLLLSLQLEMVSISTACRKVDQMLQHLAAKVNHQLVYKETLQSFQSIVHSDQVLSLQDLQRACMFLEDSAVGREVWRESYMSMLQRVSESLPVVLQEESQRDGLNCYITVKVCLQVFQLLPSKVAPLVWEENHSKEAVQKILQALMDIIFGQCCNRDTRLLAGTAVAMLINTASESRVAGAAAWDLLQASYPQPCQLAVGVLQVRCHPAGKDGVERLAVSRGLLTCCPPHVLLSPNQNSMQTCLLLDGLFPLVYALCEEKRDCHYLAFEVLTLWLKKVKECVTDLWKMTGARLLPDDSRLLQQLTHIVWTNAESPVEGVPEFASSAFTLLLNLYAMDCEHFCDTKKTFYFTLLERLLKLPWEAKAKYHRLCALLPYVGADTMLPQYTEVSSHLLKCLSTNHLSPCGSEFYKCLIQQQRRELPASLTELDLAGRWAKSWQPFLLEALTSEVTLLQTNSSTHLLPCTFQVFSSAVHHLLASLNPHRPGHLHAWACILSSSRAISGCSPWDLQGSSTFKTLQLALGSADDKTRLAALNLLCYSSKTRDIPSTEEMKILKEFIPQNLNCESSPFRQHLQAALRRFLVRIRDGCLAHIREVKGKKKDVSHESRKDLLEQGIGFVEWLGQLPYSFLSPGHSYQRKKTALLLLSAVLETCTDTWSPDKKKGQPPGNIGLLIDCARQRGQWEFFSRTKQLLLISCLEDSTNEIRELSAGMLLRFFPPGFPADIAEVLETRSRQLLCSPRVQEAQMGALMMKILLQNCSSCRSGHRCEECSLSFAANTGGNPKALCMVRVLLKELEEHYLTAQADMMLSTRTKPIHGVLCALQRCLLEAADDIYTTLDHSLMINLLELLENISLLLLAVLHGDREACVTGKYAPPSFCDMGNAISSLISQQSGCNQTDEEDCVLLSEEHSLVLTCCWVSLKETGIFLGSLVEKILKESKQHSECLLTKQDLTRASKVFKDILLKCRHWGAVEGCCIGFTKFCTSLLSSSDPDLKDIPAQMLKDGLQVVQCPRSTSVTRRAAGLPMLILCVLSAEEASKTRPLLAFSMQTLLDTARRPLDENWDQTLDLPQVCAVHTLQALVRGAGLGAAVLQFAPGVAILSLTLLRSPCWAMRNAALQLYSSLCSRVLGQRSSIVEAGPTQHSMSPAAFFFHYPELQPFLLGELRGEAQHLQRLTGGAKLHLQPSLYLILTLLAQLQPGIQDSSEALLDFLPALLQLSASPIYSVRVMASKALVAMTPPSAYMDLLIKLTSKLPGPQESCYHNRLHGQVLQIKALLDRALSADSVLSDDLREVVSRIHASMWLGTAAQRCPLVRAVYLSVADSLRKHFCETFLMQLSDKLMHDLHTPQQGLQVGLSSFHQQALNFLCTDPKWACQIWENFSAAPPELRLSLVSWLQDRWGLMQTDMKEVIQRVLQSNLKEALLGDSVDYRTRYLAALIAVITDGGSALPQPLSNSEPCLSECLHLLLQDLEVQKGGPEFLSQALNAASLLLSQWSNFSLKTSILQRWCSVLECQRTPEAPEVLRVMCSEVLCAAGVLLINTLREHSSLPAIMMRLINTGLYLLQDQSPQARQKVARFASLLHHSRQGDNQSSVYIMQINRALLLLLDLLLQECWDTPGTLELLLSHLPQTDLISVLKEASATGGTSSLYEQDEVNVFAEPSIMSAHMLPYLLQMADKSSQSSALAQTLTSWAEENVAQVLDNLTACEQLQPAKTFSPSWLALLMDPSFHNALCGLLTRVAFLLHLLKTSACIRHLCDPLSMQMRLQAVCSLLSENGVHFPPALTAAVAAGDTHTLLDEDCRC